MWEQECVLAVYLKQRYERVRLWKEHRKICILNTSTQLSCVTSLIALRLCIQSAYLLVLLNLVQYLRYLKHFSHRIVKRVSFCEASGLGNYWKLMCCPVLGSKKYPWRLLVSTPCWFMRKSWGEFHSVNSAAHYTYSRITNKTSNISEHLRQIRSLTEVEQRLLMLEMNIYSVKDKTWNANTLLWQHNTIIQRWRNHMT